MSQIPDFVPELIFYTSPPRPCKPGDPFYTISLNLFSKIGPWTPDMTENLRASIKLVAIDGHKYPNIDTRKWLDGGGSLEVKGTVAVNPAKMFFSFDVGISPEADGILRFTERGVGQKLEFMVVVHDVKTGKQFYELWIPNVNVVAGAQGGQ